MFSFAVCRKGDSAMGVVIEAIPESVRVKMSGDIDTVISVPYKDDDRFLVGLSDGTLLMGSYDDDPHCRFDVVRDGAGIVRTERGKAIIGWRVEWETVSAYDANVVEPKRISPMPYLQT
jgi:hypothetical protein